MKRSVESIAGWGNFRPVRCSILRPTSEEECRRACDDRTFETWIARGLGRSYGDSAVNSSGFVLDPTKLSQPIQVDWSTGTCTAPASLSLGSILSQVVPRGFFLPVTPGTQYVTVGGAVAADVHGKNHHRDGSFGRHVKEIRLLTGQGETITCSATQHPALFFATQGGMGLTGLIQEVTFQLLPITSGMINVQTIRTTDLDDTFARLEETAARSQYSVSWIDALAQGRSLGRGWVLAGDHATSGADLPKWSTSTAWSVPCSLPTGLLSRTTCSWFNRRVYRKGIVSSNAAALREFFYPLDRVGHWNRIYGRNGFIQYQAVFPRERARDSITQMLEQIVRSGVPAFFAGIKSCGPQGPGPLSFLMPGMTIGIDFPNRPGLALLAQSLDELVVRAGGRVYLAKDSLLTPQNFASMYPRLDEFRSICDAYDPERRIASDQSRRLRLRV